MEASTTQTQEGLASPSLDGTVLVFDTETVNHELTLELRYFLKTDDARSAWSSIATPFGDRPGWLRAPRRYLRRARYRARPRLKLVKLEWLFQNGIWPARKHGWVIAGTTSFTILADRRPVGEGHADRAPRGALLQRLCVETSFHDEGRAANPDLLSDQTRRPPPRSFRDEKRRRGRYARRRLCVHRPEPLAEEACKAWGIPFEDRPGEHSGEITFDNVAGCLYDVQKTAELLWAIDDEHKKYPHRPHLATFPPVRRWQRAISML